GLAAAFLARSGFTSSERAIEAPAGFAHVLSGDRDLALAVDALGERFELMANTYKPFACGLVVHPVIDGCLALRAEHGVQASEIERIDLKVNALVVELTGKASPATGLEAKFSVYHSAAVAIVHGAAGEAQYADTAVNDAAVVALREKVRVEIVPD